MNIKDTSELLGYLMTFAVGVLLGGLVGHDSGFRSGKKEGPTPIIVKLPPSAVTLQTNFISGVNYTNTRISLTIDTKGEAKMFRLKEIEN